jgi:hypothetical protein
MSARSLLRHVLIAALALGWAAAAAPMALAEAPVFSPAAADVPLGGPYVFATSVSMADQPKRVELLLGFPGQEFSTVITATVSGANGNWRAQATYDGHILPNSLLHYQFRVTDAGGSVTDGPPAQILTTDERFDWKTVSGPVVRLHWNGGSADFGQRALDIGERAVSRAAQLLGVTETQPIDFFVYDNEQAFRDALGPGLRENVAGTAFATNRTMYAYILPSQVGDEWVDILVTHELTHLVFDTATDNIYRPAPHWLNEGVATYLSEGLSTRWQVALNGGKASGALIPLEGMVATFGAGETRFDLGYAESVAAVDYFVRTYGEPRLWGLIRSYSEGLSDDDAFKRATGLDLPGFNAAWMQSLGVTVPPELGPQPGPTSAPGGASGPRPSAGGGPGIAGAFGSGLAVIALVVIVVVVVLAVRLARRRSSPPPPASWPPSDWASPPLPPPPASSLPPWRGPDDPPPPDWRP